MTSESESLDVLIDNTEAALVAFMRAAAEAKEREAQLFALLFDERSELKRSFATTESVARAKQARREIRTEAIETAKLLGYKISGRFETDGEWNGMDPDCVREFAAFQLKRDAERGREHHRAELALHKRVAARRVANPEYQHPLYESGELIPEMER